VGGWVVEGWMYGWVGEWVGGWVEGGRVKGWKEVCI